MTKIDSKCKPLIEIFIKSLEKCKCGIKSHEHKVNKIIEGYKSLINQK